MLKQLIKTKSLVVESSLNHICVSLNTRAVKRCIIIFLLCISVCVCECVRSLTWSKVNVRRSWSESNERLVLFDCFPALKRTTLCQTSERTVNLLASLLLSHHHQGVCLLIGLSHEHFPTCFPLTPPPTPPLHPPS